MGLSKYAADEVERKIKDLFGAFMSGRNAYDDPAQFSMHMRDFAKYLRTYHTDANLDAYFNPDIAIAWFDE